MEFLNISFENGFSVTDAGNGAIIVDYEGPTGVWTTDKEIVYGLSFNSSSQTIGFSLGKPLIVLTNGASDN